MIVLKTKKPEIYKIDSGFCLGSSGADDKIVEPSQRYLLCLSRSYKIYAKRKELDSFSLGYPLDNKKTK